MHTMMFTGFFLFVAFEEGPEMLGENWLFAGPAFENQRSVGAAKSKRIRQRVFEGSFARLVGHIVQIACRVRRFLIDRRRQNLVAQRQHTDAGLEAARAPEQMPGHLFCRSHRSLLGALTENSLQSYRFQAIT